MPLLGPARAERSRDRVEAELRSAGRPHLAANAALGLVSAALAAALFLIVLLLIEGWRLSPIAAAAAVTVMPICALAAAPLAGRVERSDARAAAGRDPDRRRPRRARPAPDASVALTLTPAGARRRRPRTDALGADRGGARGRSPQAIHGGWTIAARHAGVVAGLLVLTPVFTADLETERDERRAGGDRGAARLAAAARRASSTWRAGSPTRSRPRATRCRSSGPPSSRCRPTRPSASATIALRTPIESEVDARATHAFSASFLIAAAFALAALIPIAIAPAEG